jgi:hypothetical protein
MVKIDDTPMSHKKIRRVDAGVRQVIDGNQFQDLFI